MILATMIAAKVKKKIIKKNLSQSVCHQGRHTERTIYIIFNWIERNTEKSYRIYTTGILLIYIFHGIKNSVYANENLIYKPFFLLVQKKIGKS